MEKISILVCDDSALMRKLTKEIIEQDSNLIVVGTAFNGRFALQKIPILKPDLIILDLEMPEMNGIEFLKERRRLNLNIPVIILSSLAKKGARITMEALELGASDFILKPSGSISMDIAVVGEDLRKLIYIYGSKFKGLDLNQIFPSKISGKDSKLDISISDVIHYSGVSEKPVQIAHSVLTFTPSPIETRFADVIPPPLSNRPHHGSIDIVAIGISTGGPNALRKVLPEFPEDFPVPILVVQHMPEGFTEEFANSLNHICKMEVKEARDGDLITPGRVFIAPGNAHIKVERKKLANVITLEKERLVNGHRPSADVLFESIAKEYGNKALGIIMTGMGKDGAKQLGSIYNAGGYTLGQDKDSSIVYGMPRVAAEYGYVEKVVPLAEMAEAIYTTVKASRFNR